jgi:hypothetical protein
VLHRSAPQLVAEPDRKKDLFLELSSRWIFWLDIAGLCSSCSQRHVFAIQHYPGRLVRLYMVGMPSNLAWVLDTVRPLLHPTTGSNLRLCEAGDKDVPLPPHMLGLPVPESPCTPDSLPNGNVRSRCYSLRLPCRSSFSPWNLPVDSCIPALMPTWPTKVRQMGTGVATRA